MARLENVTVRLAQEELELIEQIAKGAQSDRSTVVRRLIELGLKEWKLEEALKLYKRGGITISRAAEMAGLSIYEMLETLKREKVPYQLSVDDLRDAFLRSEKQVKHT